MRTRISELLLRTIAAFTLSIGACVPPNAEQDVGDAQMFDAGADAGSAPDGGVPSPPFSLLDPSGPYAVGTHVRSLVDSTRGEPATADPSDSRSVVLQLFYPVVPSVAGAPSPWLDPPLSAAVADGTPLPTDWAEAVRAHSILDAPMATSLGALPVLVASHGLGSSRRYYTTLFEDLASHGFVVAAIEHPHDAMLTVFPDGTLAGADSDAIRASQMLPATPTPSELEAFFVLLDSYIDLWVSDARFVLDRLALINGSDPSGIVDGQLDLSLVGMFGHSFGGATSAEVCALDDRVDACANLDGAFVGPERLAGGRVMTKPFMTMATVESLATSSSFDEFYANQAGPAYMLVIQDLEHPGFMDLWFGLRAVAGALPQFDAQAGTLPSDRALTIVRHYLGAFFEKHLKGLDAAVLDAPNAEYPEVAIEAK